MDILIDRDQSLTYETNGHWRKLFNSLFIPVMNVLPARSNRFIRMSHKSVDEVVSNATTHKALEVLYKKGHKKHSISWFQRFMHRLWFDMNNSKAVRNRLKLVKREFKRLLILKSQQHRSISILSIASGSARAVIESIVETNGIGGSIAAIFLDKNPDALEYSKQLTKEYHIDENANCDFKWVNGSAGTFLTSLEGRRFDIVEMVGLLDYFDDEKAVEIFRNIKSVLSDKGSFITANISHNSEEPFMTTAIGWKMIYRSASELGELLIKAGFRDREIRLYYEPLQIHAVAVATLE